MAAFPTVAKEPPDTSEAAKDASAMSTSLKKPAEAGAAECSMASFPQRFHTRSRYRRRKPPFIQNSAMTIFPGVFNIWKNNVT